MRSKAVAGRCAAVVGGLVGAGALGVDGVSFRKRETLDPRLQARGH
jgi:hypothetical protein